MRDILKDIVKHTHGLGIIQAVKVTTDDNSTVLDAMDDDRTVVLRAKMHNRVEEFAGKFGMGRLGVTSGYLSYENTDDSGKSYGADISVGTMERNGETVPSEFKFSMKGVFDATYRVISSETSRLTN